MDKKTNNLLKLIYNYMEKKGTYDAIVKYVKDNYKKYTVWDNFPKTKYDFDNQNRNFILENLSKLKEKLVEERIEWNSIFIKLNNENGVLINYGSNRLFIVTASAIETYVS